MTAALSLLALAATVLAVATLAERRGVSAPLALTLVGIAASFLPWVPEIRLEPEVVLLGLLPPLLYAAAIRTSLLDLGANKHNIALLSIGLVLVTAVAVGLVVWWLLDVPLPLALALGGVVAPPDAVAATAVARRIGLPRRIVTVLEGESLFNDATALVVVRMGILALGSAVTAWQVAGQFLWAAGGGILVGLIVAKIVNAVRARISETVPDTALGFLAPWLAYLPAELLHCSGVLSVVVAGVLLGHASPVSQSAASRMSERINWRTVAFLLENVVFLLIGLQARMIVTAVGSSDLGWARAVIVCVAVLGTVVIVRPLVVVPAQVLRRHTDEPLAVRAKSGMLVSAAGMRGVVTLAAVLTIPADVPHYDVLVLAALVVTAGTLLLQGFSLPWVARKLGQHGPDPREDVLQAANVLQRAVTAGRAELDQAVTDHDSPEVVELLHAQAIRRSNAVWEQLGAIQEAAESPSETQRRLRRVMLRAERAEVLRVRDTGRVDHEVLEQVMSTLDLEEAMLTTMTARQANLEERLVVTPDVVRGDCDHLREAPVCVTPLTPDGCGDCLQAGTSWVHLRLCLECGAVGCCDSSPGRHATKHFRATGHPVMRSLEPGEAWRWCYIDEQLG